MASPNPWRQPTLFDLFWLDNKAPPGLTTIKSGGTRTGEYQDMQVPGTQGATSNFRFEKVGGVAYEIKVWTLEHLKLIEPYLATLEAAFESRPVKRLKITDYRFAHNKIQWVTVQEIGPQILHAEGPFWTYDVAFKQAKPRAPIGGLVKPPANSRERLITELGAGNSVLQSAIDIHNAARAAAKKK